jgi:hypothetical protein
MATSGDQNPKPYANAAPQFTLICLRIHAVLCSRVAGSTNSVTQHCHICLFLEMPDVLKTVCMQIAAAGLLHISELTFCGLNITFKLRCFLVFINLLAPEFYI